MHFSNNWFNNSELKNMIHLYLDKNKPNKILEIGCFEGQSSCFFSNEYLQHPESKLICVDPFDVSDITTDLRSNTKQLFYNNIGETSGIHKIKVHEEYSTYFFPRNKEKYNFIYIDGSHLEQDVAYDFISSIYSCEEGGIIWLDDYVYNPKVSSIIDKVYDIYSNHLEKLHCGWQAGFRKTLKI